MDSTRRPPSSRQQSSFRQPPPPSTVSRPPTSSSSALPIRETSKREREEALLKDTFRPSEFGGIGDYLRHKRAKLQLQNAEVANNASSAPAIFKNLIIYINGYTNPSPIELRAMFLAHGGRFEQYLDRKTAVTHVIASNLTPSKMKEYARMKVVRPAWIVDSVAQGRRLAWGTYIWTPENAELGTQLAPVVAQRTLDFQAQQTPSSALSGATGSSRASEIKGKERVTPENEETDEEEGEGDMIVMDAPPSPAPLPPKESRRKAVSQPLRRTGSRSSTRLSGRLDPVEGNSKPPAFVSSSSKVAAPLENKHHTSDLPAPSTASIPISSSTVDNPSIAFEPDSTSRRSSPGATGRAEGRAKTSYAQAVAKKGWYLTEENKQAKKLMEDEKWREKNTAVNEGFLEGYFANSRLHHLSTWKAELKQIVAKAQEDVHSADVLSVLAPGSQSTAQQAGSRPGTAHGRLSLANHSLTSSRRPQLNAKSTGTDRRTREAVVFHCDFDAFFVAVSLLNRPHLKGQPVVVCHSDGRGGGEGSTSEIASASYEARAFGIKAGQALGQARKLCKDVQAIPYEFEMYKSTSVKFYTILMAYADVLEAVSIDEVLLDVTSRVRTLEQQVGGTDDLDWAVELAERIRDDVRSATACEISIGIGSNKLLSRLATQKAKPAGSFHLTSEEVPAFLDPLDVGDLWGIGQNTRDKIANALKTTRVGELAARRLGELQDVLGPKNGKKLFDACRGIDDRKVESETERKSVSAEVNYGIRFKTQEEADGFLMNLGKEVSVRLNKIGRLGAKVTLKVMIRAEGAPFEAPKFMGHGHCVESNRSKDLGRATDDAVRLGGTAITLLKLMKAPPEELRGIGLMVTKLEARNIGHGREAGQMALYFASRPSAAKLATPVHSRSASPLPLAARPQPSIVEIDEGEEDNNDDNYGPQAGPSKAAGGPGPGTPANLRPTLSQVDFDVLNALPSSVIRDMYPDYQRPPLAADRSTGAAQPGPSRATDGSPKKKRNLPDVSHITKQLRPQRESPVKGVGPFELMAQAGPSRPKQPDRGAVAGSLDDELVVLAGLLGWDLSFLQGLPEQTLKELVEEGRRERSRLGLDKGKGRQAKSATRSPEKRSVGQPLPAPPPPVKVVPPYPLPPILGPRKKQDCPMRAFRQSVDDLRDLLSVWIEHEASTGPRQKGVDTTTKFILACLTTRGNGNMERGMAMLKWWEYELKNRWSSDGEDEVGRLWWEAYESCFGKVNEVFVERWGGPLLL